MTDKAMTAREGLGMELMLEEMRDNPGAIGPHAATAALIESAKGTEP